MKSRPIIFAALLAASAPALAGGGGGMTGGSTEMTQLLNKAMLMDQYAMQAQQYAQQLQQTQAMLTNLLNNPMGLLPPDLQRLAADVARLYNTGVSIANSIQRLDEDFARTFQSVEAMDFAQKFKSWSQASTNGMRNMMMNAGIQRENFASDAQALQALVSSAQAAQGNLGALQAIAAINARQVQESMQLRDLISAQQIETAKYMTAAVKKEQEIADVHDRLWRIENKPLSPPRPKRPGQF